MASGAFRTTLARLATASASPAVKTAATKGISQKIIPGVVVFGSGTLFHRHHKPHT